LFQTALLYLDEPQNSTTSRDASYNVNGMRVSWFGPRMRRQYPALTYPTLASPEAHGGKMRYRFQRGVGTKGQSCALSLSLTRSLLALCSF
jgi:hypothetical protein